MASQPYDVIVVGARVAGAATAMLLARAGLRVLVVDRARFPSDTLSTHAIQLTGVSRLRRWGLLERLGATGTPATREVHFDLEYAVLQGRFPEYNGVDALHCARRTVLDALLVDAAREAGAEVRENVAVEALTWDAGRVTGIEARERGGPSFDEQARLVVGADGKHSFVADAVNAPVYRQVPTSTFASYTYWSGTNVTGEIYQRPGRAVVAAFPTNDDLAVIFVSAPLADFASFRTDVEGHYLKILDLCGDLGDRVRSGQRAERFRTTPDLPHQFRVPRGPGWALVGDAGLVLDPISAHGISQAFRDAELLTEAVTAALADGQPLDARLANYHNQRDAAASPIFDFTTQLAEFAPPSPRQQLLMSTIAERPEATRTFLGVFAGAIPQHQLFSLRSAVRLLGVRRLIRGTRAVAG
ncbi:MAG TPA: NAD(P)/FAD-dependent oxidoreductase [Jiangellaceae bacterium]|nr:NAD(P)/FAD-dependent oxidoreductase [Jiangellaceae bacterium]